MKQQSQKKNKKLIAGAIFGMAAGLAAASVPVIIPLMINGAVAKPSEGNTINFIGEEPINIHDIYPDLQGECIVSDKVSVDTDTNYELIVDSNDFAEDFSENEWGIAVGKIDTSAEEPESLIKSISITYGETQLSEGRDYAIENGVVTGKKPLKRGKKLFAQITVVKSEPEAQFMFISFEGEKNPQILLETKGKGCVYTICTPQAGTTYDIVCDSTLLFKEPPLFPMGSCIVIRYTSIVDYVTYDNVEVYYDGVKYTSTIDVEVDPDDEYLKIIAYSGIKEGVTPVIAFKNVTFNETLSDVRIEIQTY